MIYILIYILLICLVYNYDFRNRKRDKKGWFKAIMLLFIFLSGFRYYVGSDTFDYSGIYPEYPSLANLKMSSFSDYRYQPGWVLFMSLCRTITDSFVLSQLIAASIFNISVFQTIKKYSRYPFIAIIFYFSAQVFTGLNFEFMRESMAVGLFLFGFKFYKNNSWINYYAFVFMAFMFHVSAALFFLFPLIKFINLDNKKFILILSSIFLIILFLGKSIISESLGYLSIGDSLSSTSISYANKTLATSKSTLFYIYTYSTYLIFPLALIFFSLSYRKDRIIFLDVLLMYFIISIVSGLSADFIRFNHYLFVFLLIELSNAFYSIIIKLKLRILFITLLPLALNVTNIHYLFFVDSSLSKRDKTYTRYHPYTCVFYKEMPEERKIFFREFRFMKNDPEDY